MDNRHKAQTIQPIFESGKYYRFLDDNEIIFVTCVTLSEINYRVLYDNGLGREITRHKTSMSQYGSCVEISERDKYRYQEISRVLTTSEYPHAIQIRDGNGNKTKWLNLSLEEVLKIRYMFLRDDN